MKTTFEHPIDIALMYKEINQCQNTIDRLDKILGVMRDDDDGKALATINSNRKIEELLRLHIRAFDFQLVNPWMHLISLKNQRKWRLIYNEV